MCGSLPTHPISATGLSHPQPHDPSKLRSLQLSIDCAYVLSATLSKKRMMSPYFRTSPNG